MENVNVNDFLKTKLHYVSDYDYGDSYGNSPCYGSGSGFGYGNSFGSGFGNGNGSGNSFGSGNGSGIGEGYSNVTEFNGHKVYTIDTIPTIITSLRNNIAKGFILNLDLTLTPTWVIKEQNLFAHGETLHNAFEALQVKLMETMDDEERIEKFKLHFKDYDKPYPSKVLYEWHYRLTGSCGAGRKAFAKNFGIDVENGSMSINQFIELIKHSYKGSLMRKLIKK